MPDLLRRRMANCSTAGCRGGFGYHGQSAGTFSISKRKPNASLTIPTTSSLRAIAACSSGKIAISTSSSTEGRTETRQTDQTGGFEATVDPVAGGNRSSPMRGVWAGRLLIRICTAWIGS